MVRYFLLCIVYAFVSVYAQNTLKKHNNKVTIEADTITKKDDIYKLQGNVNVSFKDQTFKSEKQLIFNSKDQIIQSVNSLTAISINNIDFKTTSIVYDVKKKLGLFENAALVTKEGITVKSSRVNVNNHAYEIDNALYTTCDTDDPTWHLKASKISINEKVLSAKGVTFYIKNTPVLKIPFFSLSLEESSRKSGLLPFSFFGTKNMGFTTVMPYYFNLAPNYDNTIFATFPSKKKWIVSDEFRLLHQNGKGGLFASMSHKKDVFANANYWFNNRYISFENHIAYSNDNNFLRDYFEGYSYNDRAINSWIVNQQYSSLSLHVNANNRLSATINKYQNLGAFSGYSMLPQLSFTGENYIPFLGLKINHNINATKFIDAKKNESKRIAGFASVTLPLYSSFGNTFFSVANFYNKQWLLNGVQTFSIPRFEAKQSLEIYGSDTFLGNAVSYTIEPIVSYVYVPYIKQGKLTNFDSQFRPISLSNLFNIKRGGGFDRIDQENSINVVLNSNWNIKNKKLATTFWHSFYLTDQKYIAVENRLMSRKKVSDSFADIRFTLNEHFFINTIHHFNVYEKKQKQITYETAFVDDTFALYNKFEQPFSESEKPAQTNQTSFYKSFNGKFRIGAMAKYSLLDKKVTHNALILEYKGCCWLSNIMVEQKNDEIIYGLNIKFKSLGNVGNIGSGSVESYLSNLIYNYKNLSFDKKPKHNFVNTYEQ